MNCKSHLVHTSNTQKERLTHIQNTQNIINSTFLHKFMHRKFLVKKKEEEENIKWNETKEKVKIEISKLILCQLFKIGNPFCVFIFSLPLFSSKTSAEEDISFLHFET